MSVKFKQLFLLLSVLLTSSVFAEQKPIVPIEKWLTKTGTPVFYVYEKELPIIDIQVVFDAGSSRDEAKAGIAKITNDALTAGTTLHSANDIASAFDDVGAAFSSAVNRDMAVVALRSLAEPQFFKPAFETFNEVLSKSTFPDNEFSRIQKQTLNALNQQDESPATIAAKAFYNAVFDDNPYGHPITGNIASVSKFTANDLRNFYKNNYTSQNALIAIVGDIEKKEAMALAETLATNLNQGPKLPKLAFSPLNEKSTVKHITFPSFQTHVMIGQMGISRDDPAYFPVMVGNYILGGGTLTSRLFDEVREKRGLAYTVRSQFSALKEKGLFAIELQTRNSEASNAIRVVNETLANFVSKGPSKEELLSAKRNLTQGFILRLASNAAIIAQIINIGYYHLPLDYLDTYQANISKVSDKEVKEVFQKIIHPNDMVTITVGNNSQQQYAQKAS